MSDVLIDDPVPYDEVVELIGDAEDAPTPGSALQTRLIVRALRDLAHRLQNDRVQATLAAASVHLPAPRRTSPTAGPEVWLYNRVSGRFYTMAGIAWEGNESPLAGEVTTAPAKAPFIERLRTLGEQYAAAGMPAIKALLASADAGKRASAFGHWPKHLQEEAYRALGEAP